MEDLWKGNSNQNILHEKIYFQNRKLENKKNHVNVYLHVTQGLEF